MIRTPTVSAERSSAAADREPSEFWQLKPYPMALSTITAPTPTRTPSPTVANSFPFPTVDPPKVATSLPSLGSIPPPSQSTTLPPISNILSPPSSSAAASPQPPSPRSLACSPSETSVYHLHYGGEEDISDEAGSNFAQPLTLAERRQRNKAASAKYRAKKQIQTHEMRSMIQDLTEQNGILRRQLDDTKKENAQLRDVCDRLRGQIVAERMIKRYFKDGLADGETVDTDIDKVHLEKRPRRQYSDYSDYVERERGV